MTYQKKNKIYKDTYFATYQRNKRARMLKTNPLYQRKCVWVVESGNKQMAFKDRKDIK